MTDSAHNCPICGTEMQVNAGYVTWCTSCNWNLNPKQIKTKGSLIERLNRRVGEKAIKSVHDEVMNHTHMRHPWTFPKAAAYFLATVINGFNLFCFYQVISRLFDMQTLGDFYVWVIYVLISYNLFPRFGRVPKQLLNRNQYPAIYRLMDSIAEKLNTKPLHHIAVFRSYNAYFTKAGLFRRRVVGIGIPMFSALHTQEKIAILAHELAHSANRDITRGWYVGRAIKTLSSWYNMIAPSTYDDDDFLPRLIWVRMKIATVIYWIWYLLGISVWREMQRAEYYADRQAANIAGTSASVTALEKLNYEPTYYLTLERVAQFRYTKDLFDEFRRMAGHVPEREKIRLERILQIDSARLDATHPPMRFRVDYLNHYQTLEPSLELDQSSIEALEVEFAKAEKSMQLGILDDYRSWFLELS